MSFLVPIDQLTFVACPACRKPLALTQKQDSSCQSCNATYPFLDKTWDMTPPKDFFSAKAWQTWQQVQANGLVAYDNDPINNLGIGEREDFSAFGNFCKFSGLVLDVGCGPQPWPSHFSQAPSGTQFIGIDPLINSPGDYTRFRGVAEHLPFVDKTFDHVVFTTSLDHFVDPIAALKEARRVVSANGVINIWIGEKDEGAPRPTSSPGWYKDLQQPDGSDDLFHIKRLYEPELINMLAAAEISLEQREIIHVDDFRRNIFMTGRP